MNTKVHHTVIKEGDIKIGRNVLIGPFSHIGYSYLDARRNYYKKNKQEHKEKPSNTCIENDTFIGPNVIIGNGTKIGSNCLIEHNSFIGENTKIGNHTFIRYGCQIYQNVKIGNDCIISGFMCKGTKIGNNVEFFGTCVHRYLRRKADKPEPAPIIGNKVFVGVNTLIIGGLRIGNGAIIKAGAIVTQDVDNYEVINAGERR